MDGFIVRNGHRKEELVWMAYSSVYSTTDLKNLGVNIAGTGMQVVIDFAYLIGLAVLFTWLMEKLGIGRIL